MIAGDSDGYESLPGDPMDIASRWSRIRALTILVLALGMVGCGNAEPAANDERVMSPSPESFHKASVVRLNSGGTVELVEGDNLSGEIELDEQYQSLLQALSYGEMALFFVQRYRNPLRLVDPGSEVTITKVQGDNFGYHQVRLAQVYQNLPVLDAEMLVHFDPQDHVYLVQSQFIPTPSGMVVTPTLTEDQVVESLAATTGTDVTGPASLSIFPRKDKNPLLVYTLETRKSMVDSRSVVIDANSGVILREIPTVYNTR